MLASDPAAPGAASPVPSSPTAALSLQVACEYGMVHVVSETGGPRGKDYCILYNPQWAHLPHDLGKAVSARWGPSLWGSAGLEGLWGAASTLGVGSVLLTDCPLCSPAWSLEGL